VPAAALDVFFVIVFCVTPAGEIGLFLRALVFGEPAIEGSGDDVCPDEVGLETAVIDGGPEMTGGGLW
jgi:hypothetical protein